MKSRLQLSNRHLRLFDNLPQDCSGREITLVSDIYSLHIVMALLTPEPYPIVRPLYRLFVLERTEFALSVPDLQSLSKDEFGVWGKHLPANPL